VTNFPPVHEVTYYQARCTNCGLIMDSYGEYTAWSDPDSPVSEARDICDWYQSDDAETLLCRQCQICTECDGSPDDDHEDHDFTLRECVT